MKTAIIVTARQSSRRLPLKHLYPIAGIPALRFLCERLSDVIDPIVALPPRSELYEAYLEDWEIRYHAPNIPENELTERIWRTANWAKVDRVVVVHGDSPLMCPRLVEQMMARQEEGYDIVWNKSPKGMRPFVVRMETFDALMELHRAVGEHPFIEWTTDWSPRMLVMDEGFEGSFALDYRNDVDYLSGLVRGVGRDGTLEDYAEFVRNRADDGKGVPGQDAGVDRGAGDGGGG